MNAEKGPSRLGVRLGRLLSLLLLNDGLETESRRQLHRCYGERSQAENSRRYGRSQRGIHHIRAAASGDCTVAVVANVARVKPCLHGDSVLSRANLRWICQHGIAFTWQEGYAAFSVSSSSKPAVVDYIEHQAEHHRGRSYEVEFETMIRKSGMRFEPEEAFG